MKRYWKIFTVFALCFGLGVAIILSGDDSLGIFVCIIASFFAIKLLCIVLWKNKKG